MRNGEYTYYAHHAQQREVHPLIAQVVCAMHMEYAHAHAHAHATHMPHAMHMPCTCHAPMPMPMPMPMHMHLHSTCRRVEEGERKIAAKFEPGVKGGTQPAGGLLELLALTLALTLPTDPDTNPNPSP